MKHLSVFLLSAAMLSVAGNVMAGTVSSSGIRFEQINDYLPGRYAADSEGRLVFPAMEADSCSVTVSVYDSSLQLEKVVNVPVPENGVAVSETIYAPQKWEWPAGTPVYIETTWWDGQLMPLTEARAIAYNEFEGTEEESRNGTVYMFPKIRDYWYEGICPRRWVQWIPSETDPEMGVTQTAFVEVDNPPVVVSQDEEKVVSTRTSRIYPLVTLSLEDYDSGLSALAGISLTQTLFVDDEEYEYLAPICELHEKTWERGDYRDVNREVLCKGFRVMTASGTEIDRVLFGESLYAHQGGAYFGRLITIGGHVYIAIQVKEMSDDFVNAVDTYTLFYEIGDGAGIRQVGAPVRSRVYPTAVTRGGEISVEFGNSEVANNVTVTGLSGRSVYSGRSAAGTQGVSLSSDAMETGMNIVTVTPEGHIPSSTKIIVR